MFFSPYSHVPRPLNIFVSYLKRNTLIRMLQNTMRMLGARHSQMTSPAVGKSIDTHISACIVNT